MTKKKAKWQEWLPKRPFKPEETIRDWDDVNLDWDDETICALCGKTYDCKCYDEFMCPCKKKNKDCKWPENVACPCRACGKRYFQCLCDKPEDKTEKEWLEIKTIVYYQKYDWENDNYSHEEDD